MAARARYTPEDIRARGLKDPDAWWTVFLVDPIASPLTLFVANRTRLRPNHVTFVSLALGLGAAWAFWSGGPEAAPAAMLSLGALLYHLSFVVDCVDGKLARITGTGSVFGMWLDYIFDRVRVGACAIALFVGQARASERDEVFLALGILVVFLDMLRYLDTLQEYKLRRVAIEAAGGAAAEAEAMADLKEGVRARLGWYPRLRDRLAAKRVRPHLFSGVEYQMAVFIVAPLTGAFVPVVAAASTLLLAFELAAIARMYASLRSIDRVARRGGDA